MSETPLCAHRASSQDSDTHACFNGGGVYFFLKAQFIPTENNFTEKSSGRIACLPSVLRGKGAMQEGRPVHL